MELRAWKDSSNSLNRFPVQIPLNSLLEYILAAFDVETFMKRPHIVINFLAKMIF